MQIKYFQTAWSDIKNSPGWFGKLCLLALLNCIPIFGQIVTFGYLYGWAREMSWGTHRPMPASIFANEDGKFWRRGWFLLVVTFVFSLIPAIVLGIGAGMQSAGLGSLVVSPGNHRPVFTGGNATLQITGSLLYLVGWLAILFVQIFMWIGYMRTSIYDRLSAGFQFGKIWKMLRHDTPGAFKIFGMNLLVGGIIGAIVGLAITAVAMVMLGVSVGSMAAAGNSTVAAAPAVISAVGFGSLFLIVLVYFATVGQLFVNALVARAVGYWTMQFDVPRWRGQDDPMPFEENPGAPVAYGAPQAPVPQPIHEPDVYAQPVAQPNPYAATQPVAQPAQPVVNQVQPAAEPVQPAEAEQQPAITPSPEVQAYEQQMAEWQEESAQGEQAQPSPDGEKAE